MKNTEIDMELLEKVVKGELVSNKSSAEIMRNGFFNDMEDLNKEYALNGKPIHKWFKSETHLDLQELHWIAGEYVDFHPESDTRYRAFASLGFHLAYAAHNDINSDEVSKEEFLAEDGCLERERMYIADQAARKAGFKDGAKEAYAIEKERAKAKDEELGDKFTALDFVKNIIEDKEEDHKFYAKIFEQAKELGYKPHESYGFENRMLEK